MSVSPSRATVGELFARLTPGQLVAIGSVLVGLLGGTFSFGYWTRERLAEVERTRLQLRVQNLENKLTHADDSLALLRLKERILGLLASYYVYRSRADSPQATEQDRNDLIQVKKNLFDEVMRHVQSGPETAVRVRLGKGVSPSLTFEDDRTTWPLPSEIFGVAD